jgi:transcriptional regulator GlxA family with amidase domain
MSHSVGVDAVTTEPSSPLARPTDGKPVPVAFLLDVGATVIDFAGPWEVFQDVEIAGEPGFELFVVAPSEDVIRASAGLQVLPGYTLETAPSPRVIVIPAQGQRDLDGRARKVAWLRDRLADTDVVMSVCTGAFLLAETGALDGRSATTHHEFFDTFETRFPAVSLARGRRFIDHGSVITAGGLTSGIDAALRVVERYYGRAVATATADFLEHHSVDWIDGVASPRRTAQEG